MRLNYLRKFDLFFLLFSIIFYYLFCLEIKPDLIYNKNLLNWPSANNRPIIFIYIISHLYIFLRLFFEKKINSDFIPTLENSSLNQEKIFTIRKVFFSIILSVFCFYAILYQFYNDGLGSHHVAKSLNDHLTVNLAPIVKMNQGYSFYLESKTGLIGPFQQMMFFLLDQKFGNLSDIFRSQLIINYIAIVFLIFSTVLCFGIKIGLIIFLSIFFTKTGILPNFNYPGWGIFLRWFPLIIMTAFLSKILLMNNEKNIKTFIYFLSIFWAISALFSKENFSLPVVSFGLVFIFINVSLKKNFFFFKYFAFLIGFFIFNLSLIIILVFGFENYFSFFEIYMEFTSRYFWGQNSLYLTDRLPLFQNQFHLHIVGKTYLSVLFQIILGVLILSGKLKKKIPHNFYLSTVVILSSSIALNLLSFLRSDLTHIRSTGMLNLTVIVFFMIFYIFYSNKKAVNNFIFSIALLIFITDVHFSLSHSKKLFKSLISYENNGTNKEIFVSREKFYRSLNLLSKNQKIGLEKVNENKSNFDESISNSWERLSQEIEKKNTTEVKILKKISSDINEMKYFFNRYNAEFIQLVDFKKTLKDNPLVVNNFYFPEFRIETLIYLLDLKTVGNFTSPMTNIWNESDLRMYKNSLRGYKNYCFFIAGKDMGDYRKIANAWFFNKTQKIYFLSNPKLSPDEYYELVKNSKKNNFLCANKL